MVLKFATTEGAEWVARNPPRWFACPSPSFPVPLLAVCSSCHINACPQAKRTVLVTTTNPGMMGAYSVMASGRAGAPPMYYGAPQPQYGIPSAGMVSWEARLVSSSKHALCSSACVPPLRIAQRLCIGPRTPCLSRVRSACMCGRGEEEGG